MLKFKNKEEIESSVESTDTTIKEKLEKSLAEIVEEGNKYRKKYVISQNISERLCIIGLIIKIKKLLV